MNKQNNRDSVDRVSIFRSYFQTGELLKDDAERGRFYTAILRYAFSAGRDKPDFSDNSLLKVAWINIRPNIDKSLHNRRPGNTNASQPTNNENRDSNMETRSERDHIQGKGEGVGKGEGDKENVLTNIKEKTAADAPAFSLNADKETFAESSMIPGPDFTKWSAGQFKRSVDAAIEAHPEYNPYRGDFIAYWTEPDRKGRYKFATEKTWETSRRMARWAKNNRDGGRGQGRGDIPADDYNARTAAEMRRLKDERA